MTAPRRIQRRRTKGWRMPEGAVYVGRDSRWGNPYKIGRFRDAVDGVTVWHVEGGDRPYTFGPVPGHFDSPERLARECAVDMFREEWAPLHIDAIRTELAGRDLACWCPLDQPCHADVLLELANQDLT